MSTITIRGLTKRFRDVVALDQVDLDVADGEFLTVLGPSGSGKTTMLLAVAGFEAPTAGSIAIDGRDVTRVPAHRRRVGLTFQSYALFPHMSVEENVAFPLRVRGVPKDKRRDLVDRVLRLVRLEGYQKRRPHQLSGGQQQRVALARALVFEPDILLLDEPLAALDRQLRQTVQVELGELQRSLGVTTVAVTHDQEEALTMSDRILVLNGGRVQQHGPPDEVYQRPCNRFVASFLGTANLFEGPIDRDSGAPVLRWDATGDALPVCRDAPSRHSVAMLRPEQIELVPPGDDAVLRGGVRTAVYLGASTRYRLEVSRDRLIEVNEPGPARFKVSDVVGLRWDPENVWILPDGTGGVSEEVSGRAPDPVTNGAAQ